MTVTDDRGEWIAGEFSAEATQFCVRTLGASAFDLAVSEAGNPKGGGLVERAKFRRDQTPEMHAFVAYLTDLGGEYSGDAGGPNVQMYLNAFPEEADIGRAVRARCERLKARGAQLVVCPASRAGGDAFGPARSVVVGSDGVPFLPKVRLAGWTRDRSWRQGGGAVRVDIDFRSAPCSPSTLRRVLPLFSVLHVGAAQAIFGETLPACTRLRGKAPVHRIELDPGRITSEVWSDEVADVLPWDAVMVQRSDAQPVEDTSYPSLAQDSWRPNEGVARYLDPTGGLKAIPTRTAAKYRNAIDTVVGAHAAAADVEGRQEAHRAALWLERGWAETYCPSAFGDESFWDTRVGILPGVIVAYDRMLDTFLKQDGDPEHLRQASLMLGFVGTGLTAFDAAPDLMMALASHPNLLKRVLSYHGAVAIQPNEPLVPYLARELLGQPVDESSITLADQMTIWRRLVGP